MKRAVLWKKTPAQREVSLDEFHRECDIKNRLKRLQWIEEYDIRFEIDDSLICVYIGNRLVVCVCKYKGNTQVVRDCLDTMYRTLGAMEGCSNRVKQ